MNGHNYVAGEMNPVRISYQKERGGKWPLRRLAGPCLWSFQSFLDLCAGIGISHISNRLEGGHDLKAS